MASNVDMRSAAFIENPFPVLADCRRRAPLLWNDSLQGWILTRYEDIRRALRDPNLSGDSITPFLDHLGRPERDEVRLLGESLTRWSVFVDPPDHTRLRGLMNMAFTSRAVEALRPNIDGIVDDLLANIEGRPVFDAIADFGYPLPATVIADMLGVPREDVDQLKRWSDDLGAFVLTSRINPERYRLAASAMAEMTGYFSDLVGRRRQDLGQDVMSGLITAQEKEDRLSADELVSTCIFLLFAGHETTTHLIGNGLLALLSHPEQLDYLRRNLGNIDDIRNAVEEILRWNGPILASVRVAKSTCEIGGQAVQAGERLFLFNAAGNRDPAMFNDPDEFDISRGDAGRQISFGYGIHFCIGAPLARLEAEVALPKLLRRFPALALDTDRQSWSDSLVIRGLTTLPLRTGT